MTDIADLVAPRLTDDELTALLAAHGGQIGGACWHQDHETLPAWPCETWRLTEQGLLQKTASGSMVWHAHDCPASFDFDECNYRCRVAREAFALAGTEPYVSAETRRDTEAYE